MAQCRPCRRRFRNPLLTPPAPVVPPSNVEGQLSLTLANVTLASAAKVAVTAALAVTLAPATLIATGVALVQGAVAATLGDVTLASTATVITAMTLEDLSGDWQFDDGTVIEWG